ncbi:MAG: hypothetical protein ACAI44_23250 [Candidatus Sericytochromatia bacterium]
MSKKSTRPRRRGWLVALGALAILAILAVVLVPQLLLRQATQKPVEAGTFVTRQEQSTSLQDKMQQALVNPGSSQNSNAQASNGQAGNEQVNNGQPPGPQSGSQQVTIEQQAPAQNANPQPGNQVAAVEQNVAAAENGTQPASQPESESRSAFQNPDSASHTTADTAEPPADTRQAAAPASNDGRFRVQLGENEISGMIFNGLSQGTAPQYRASIEGVSTRISGGRARITVALLPRHLPEAFLKNLPGVNRDTPTVYLGGELSLHREGDEIVPDIHELSLGNFRVPMPFIRDAVKATVRQQADQMLRLPNGQQARLDEVILDNGALTLVGHVGQ